MPFIPITKYVRCFKGAAIKFSQVVELGINSSTTVASCITSCKEHESYAMKYAGLQGVTGAYVPLEQ